MPALTASALKAIPQVVNIPKAPDAHPSSDALSSLYAHPATLPNFKPSAPKPAPSIKLSWGAKSYCTSPPRSTLRPSLDLAPHAPQFVPPSNAFTPDACGMEWDAVAKGMAASHARSSPAAKREAKRVAKANQLAKKPDCILRILNKKQQVGTVGRTASQGRTTTAWACKMSVSGQEDEPTEYKTVPKIIETTGGREALKRFVKTLVVVPEDMKRYA